MKQEADMKNIIVAIAKKVDEKHGDKLLTLDPESTEMKMRFVAMDATVNHANISNTCSAFFFTVIYTATLLGQRIKNLFV